MTTAIPETFAEFYNDQEAVTTIDGTQAQLDADKQLYSMFRTMVDDIKLLKGQGYQTTVAWSKGKDSTCVLLAELQAQREFLSENPTFAPANNPVVVTSIDTGVENVWIQIHGRYEEQRLKRYCRRVGLTLELLTARPPLAERWTSLFLTAHKLPSVGRLNNDCSVILKIDQSARLLKTINERFGSDRVVTLLGSRIEESLSRAESIRRHSNDVAVDEVMANGKSSKVFMPIRDWTYEDVMGLLSRAGSNPQSRPSPEYAIPGYGENFRILRVIYGDADSGSCPVSAHKIKGANKQAGCGGSRFGCGLCLKVPRDRSVENQNQKVRYKHLQGDLKKVRDYIFSVSQDVRHRTYHARAIDTETGHVVLQPNVLNAMTIERIALYLMQLTDDDAKRAEHFKGLVAQGHAALMTDPGYADIMTDPELSLEDRDELRQVYVEGAQQHLINILGVEEAVYLDAIHSRDGVRLPPYRMTALLAAVHAGKRLPYPRVDLSKVRVDAIPDARMMPIDELPVTPIFRPTDIIEADFRSGCVSVNNDASESYTLVVRQSSENTPTWSLSFKGRIVPLHALLEEDLADIKAEMLAALASSERSEIKRVIKLRHRREYALPQQVNSSGVKAEPYRNWSRRKATVKKGVISKGRSSVLFYRFDSRSLLERAHVQARPFWLPSWTRTEARIYSDVRDVTMLPEHQSNVGYAINPEALSDWLQFSAEHAFDAHNDAVLSAQKKRYSRFRYAGVGVFEELLRQGVLCLNSGTEATSQAISDRTAMFNRMGLFERKDNRTLAQAGISMSEYRQIKAKRVATLRQDRTASRRRAAQMLENVKDSPAAYAATALSDAAAVLMQHYQSIYSEWLAYALGVHLGQTGFDDVNFQARAKVSRIWLDETETMLADVDVLSKTVLLDEHRAALNSDWQIKAAMVRDLAQYQQQLETLRTQAQQQLQTRVFSQQEVVPYWLLLVQMVLAGLPQATELSGWHIARVEQAQHDARAFFSKLQGLDAAPEQPNGIAIMPAALVGRHSKLAMANALVQSAQP
ncbi:hypothetical protein IC617_08495 [Neiella sp. HB171785]|uniref:Phosphoadenosine phosphosulphate reductase domain-containing protein n=1 Tax=Neiella litorisoli TaxID=2771431 RepID=A0A8J6QRP1_9GAMM|nr:hypothetical protein [Neiella litorisoli]MBD1389464.1 hypothetical protein [Neiella litorisoli]